MTLELESVQDKRRPGETAECHHNSEQVSCWQDNRRRAGASWLAVKELTNHTVHYLQKY